MIMQPEIDPASLNAETNRPGEPQLGVAVPINPFDPARLRLTQDFASAVGVKKKIITVPVRKPDKSWFVQVHPDQNYHLETAVIELKEDRETYLVDPELWPDLAAEATFGHRALFTTITRQHVVFIWPIRLPGQDGRLDEWNTSALEAATMAQGKWVRVMANMHLGAYEVYEAQGELSAPQFPDVPFADLLHIAFKDCYIDSLDHPVLRKLRGEV
jgi:hypothetical protein